MTQLPFVQVLGQVLGTLAEPAQGSTAERWRCLSWAFLTLETVQSDEFLKHSICLVSRGRELSPANSVARSPSCLATAHLPEKPVPSPGPGLQGAALSLGDGHPGESMP